MGVDGGQVGKWKAGKGIGKKHADKIKQYINTVAVYGDLTKGSTMSFSDKGEDWVCIEGNDFEVKTMLDVQFLYAAGQSGRDVLVGIILNKTGKRLAHFTQKGLKFIKFFY
jgi:hypothetical protein